VVTVRVLGDLVTGRIETRDEQMLQQHDRDEESKSNRGQSADCRHTAIVPETAMNTPATEDTLRGRPARPGLPCRMSPGF
jgi:hypothetical protein